MQKSNSSLTSLFVSNLEQKNPQKQIKRIHSNNIIVCVVKKLSSKFDFYLKPETSLPITRHYNYCKITYSNDIIVTQNITVMLIFTFIMCFFSPFVLEKCNTTKSHNNFIRSSQ